jgi:hypothetical protein
LDLPIEIGETPQRFDNNSLRPGTLTKWLAPFSLQVLTDWIIAGLDACGCAKKFENWILPCPPE